MRTGNAQCSTVQLCGPQTVLPTACAGWRTVRSNPAARHGRVVHRRHRIKSTAGSLVTGTKPVKLRYAASLQYGSCACAYEHDDCLNMAHLVIMRFVNVNVNAAAAVQLCSNRDRAAAGAALQRSVAGEVGQGIHSSSAPHSGWHGTWTIRLSVLYDWRIGFLSFDFDLQILMLALRH